MNSTSPQDSDWRSDASLWFRPADLPHRPRRIPDGVHGNGRLATGDDLRDLLAAPTPGSLHLPDVSVLVEGSADGSTLTPLAHHGLTLPPDVRERHLLAVGTTGAGKTQKLILPQLAADVADTQRAIIALDAKGGVLYGYLKALAKRLRPTQDVHLINLRSAARNSLVWNPAHRIQTRSEAMEIAYAVCSNAETGSGSGHATNEAFWLFSSVNLLADTLRLLADDPREQASLARAKEVIDKDSYGLATVADNHPYSKEFSKRYPAVVRVLEGNTHVTQQSIVADLAMRMMLFGDEDIARTTSGPNQLDVRHLIRTGGILVLEVPEAHARQLIPLTNLFVTRLFSALLEESLHAADGRLPRPCSVVLDELGSACGKLPDFEVRLSTLRSRGVSVSGAVQTLAQLEHIYKTGARSVLDGFCTKLFFGGGLGQPDAKYAAELAGTCTVASVSETRTRDVHGGIMRSRTTVPLARAVLLPEEVARPPENPLLGCPVMVYPPNRPPFWAYFPAAYAQAVLSACLAEGEQIEAALRETARAHDQADEQALLKDKLGWDQLTGPALAWWTKRDADALLALLRGLAMEPPRGERTLLEEAYQASRHCSADDLEEFLAYLRYWVVKQAKKAKREASPT